MSSGGKIALTVKHANIIIDLPSPAGGDFYGIFIMKQDQTLKRLKTIEGHMRGVIRMVENDEYCIDVIRQIQAVQAALNKG